MAMFEFVPQAEFEAELAEHLAALEVSPDELTPPQQRAAEEAQQPEPAGPGPLAAVFSHQG